MASGTYFSGKDGSVSLNAVIQPSIRWKVEVKGGEIETTNQKSAKDANGIPWEEFIGGFAGASIEVTCIDDPTLPVPPIQTVIPFLITKGPGRTIAGSFVLKDIGWSLEDLKNRPLGVTYMGRITGPPTIV